MTRNNNHTQDLSEIFLHSPAVDAVEKCMWLTGAVLRDSGIISEKDFDRTSVGRRKRIIGKIQQLRRPVSQVSGHSPEFIINADVYRSHLGEFRENLRGPLNETEAERLTVLYSAFSAWGEFAFMRLLTSSAYTRTPKRLKAISDLLTDRSDFTEHFSTRFAGTDLSKVMENVDDSSVLQINGLRAGLTMVRAGMQTEGMDMLTDDVVLACNSGLERFIGEEGTRYSDTASRYLKLSAEQGVNTFNYAIPEWMLVMALPLPSAKIESLVSDEWVDKIGGRDWNPSIDLTRS